LAACPSSPTPARDGGTPCSSDNDCNPAGRYCGAIARCISGVCSATTLELACDDGGYPDQGAGLGQCVDYTDCNPLEACGALVDCQGFLCAFDGGRVQVSCSDAGDGGDVATGEAGQAAGDAGGADGGDAGGAG
jgi:hypothetical protein